MNLMRDALLVVCPDCKAGRHQPCVYLPLPHVDYDFLHYRSKKVRERVALTGQPTQRPHNGRLNRVAEIRYQVRKRIQRPPLAPVDRDRIAAARALRQFDIREYEELRAWLAVNARVLTG
jgi:hypothetical protein